MKALFTLGMRKTLNKYAQMILRNKNQKARKKGNELHLNLFSPVAHS